MSSAKTKLTVKNGFNTFKPKNRLKTFIFKAFSLTLSLFVLILTCLSFSACNYKQVLNFNYFNTDIHIEVDNGNISASLENEIITLLEDIEQSFSVTDENSKINELNGANANATVNFSENAIKIIKDAKTVYNLTDKKFNPCLYPLSKIWQFNGDNSGTFTFPDKKEFSNFTSHPELLDFDFVVIENNAVYKSISGLQLDFGGIAKGYASQIIGEKLKQNGFNSGYVNVGGSSIYILSAQSLAIRHPRASLNNNVIINVNGNVLSDKAVSTSGDYENYHIYEGQRYCHIIDGKTLAPTKKHVASATVIGGNGSILDGLSTALCLLDYDSENVENSEIYTFISNLLNTEDFRNSLFFIVYDDKESKQVLTNATTNCFTLLDNSYTLKQLNII